MAIRGSGVRDKLEKHLEALKGQERQAHANFNAAYGARQFCEQLIRELQEEEDAEGRQRDTIGNQAAGKKR